MTFMTFHILGMSSSQLTNSIIFQRGRYTTNQIWLNNVEYSTLKVQLKLIQHNFTSNFNRCIWKTWTGHRSFVRNEIKLQNGHEFIGWLSSTSLLAVSIGSIGFPSYRPRSPVAGVAGRHALRSWKIHDHCLAAVGGTGALVKSKFRRFPTWRFRRWGYPQIIQSLDHDDLVFWGSQFTKPPYLENPKNPRVSARIESKAGQFHRVLPKNR